MDKILFICEGESREKQFCNFIIDKYFIQNNKEKEYVAYGTNIYGLYDEISKDKGLNIVELIKERALSKNDKVTYDKLSLGGFSEIYLIFDFDFQAPEPQFDINKIMKMVKLFDNETEYGKLYINYPMIESFKHFKSIPDKEYNSYMVSKEDSLKYKKIVGDLSAIPHFSDITEKVLEIIIKQSIDKCSYISNINICNYEIYLKVCSQKKILKIQIQKLNEENKVFVLNTGLFWGIDYFGREYFNKYYNIEF